MSHARGKKGFKVNRINESRRESTGDRNTMVMRSPKVAPSSGLVMLKLDGTNITSWEDAMRHHLEVTYGPVGCFIQHNVLLVRPIMAAHQLNAMYPGHNAAGLAALHISATTEHMKATAKDNSSYVEMFSLIEQCVWTRSRQMLVMLLLGILIIHYYYIISLGVFTLCK
jgi:hypothetical protein